MVKIVADAATDEILGVHMVGPMVSELISEAVVAMEFKASAEDIARICHAHADVLQQNVVSRDIDPRADERDSR